MKLIQNKPPRVFVVGKNKNISISDCGSINLEHNEQVTFLTDDGKEYDVVSKEWGFYATPSINKRLAAQGFKTALVKNYEGVYFIMLVEKEKVSVFKKYLAEEKNFLIQWLDNV